MPKPESGTEYAFLLVSCYREGSRLSNEIFVIKKMDNGLRAPLYGETLPGQFTKDEKEKLEELLKRIRSPRFRG